MNEKLLLILLIDDMLTERNQPSADATAFAFRDLANMSRHFES